MEVLLIDQLVAIGTQGRVKFRKLSQGDYHGFDQETEQGELDAAPFGFGLFRLTESFQVRYICFVKLGNVGYIDPVAVQVLAAESFQA